MDGSYEETVVRLTDGTGILSIFSAVERPFPGSKSVAFVRSTGIPLTCGFGPHFLTALLR